MMRPLLQWAAVTLLLVTGVLACRADEKTAQGVAERFVDQHYVEIDLAAAKPFCTGLALKKIEEEQRLTAGQAIDESTRKPQVRYKLIDKKEDADRPTFVFEGSIHVDGADTFTRKWIVSTRRDGPVWKVSNFEEFE